MTHGRAALLALERQMPLAGRSVLALALAALVVGCDQRGKAGLATFAGQWQGHGRGLTITKKGQASEVINTGCCYLAVVVKFQLSRPRGTLNAASATATVTAVRIGDKSWFSKAHPPPHVGDSRTISLRGGVITETLTRDPLLREESDGLAHRGVACGRLRRVEMARLGAPGAT